MNAQLAISDSATAAGRILDAVQAGNLAGLEVELHRPWPQLAGLPPDSAERWELLDAVACQMRGAIARMRRRSANAFEGAEVHLRLLQHLSQKAPTVLA